MFLCRAPVAKLGAMFEPKTKDDYLDLVDQAIFEANDLLFSAEHEGDEDDLAGFIPVYEQLARALQALHEDVRTGRHRFGDGADLAFMPLVERFKAKIPMYRLLKTLNDAHRGGLK